MWDKLFIHSQNSTVQALQFGNGWVISSTINRAYDYLFMLGLDLNHVSKMGPLPSNLTSRSLDI